MSNPDVDTLRSDPSFRLVLELGFEEVIPFVFKQIRTRGAISTLYMGVNLLMLGIILVTLLTGLADRSMTWGSLFRQSITGILAGSVAMIPVHELLHGLVYRLLGAKKIRFGADLRQFLFFVTADRHTISGSQLHLLALAPFLVINLTALVLTLTLLPDVLLFSAFLLLSHNIMCIGDFAISNFVWNAPKKLYSFDEPELRRSYFYEKVES